MKTFLTTAAIVAALTMPALAQSAGTDSRGDAMGTAKSSTSAQDGKGPNAQDNPTRASGANTKDTGSSGMGGMKPAAANEKAGETGAGEAGAKVK